MALSNDIPRGRTSSGVASTSRGFSTSSRLRRANSRPLSPCCQSDPNQVRRHPRQKMLKGDRRVSLTLIATIVAVFGLLLFLLYYFGKSAKEELSCRKSGCVYQQELLDLMLIDPIIACDDFHAFVCQRWKENNALGFDRNCSQEIALEIQHMLNEIVNDSEAYDVSLKTLGTIYQSCLTSQKEEVIQQAHQLMSLYNIGFDNDQNVSFPLATALQMSATIGSFGLFHFELKERLLVSQVHTPYLKLIQTENFRVVLDLISRFSKVPLNISYYVDLALRLNKVNDFSEECKLQTLVANSASEDPIVKLLISALKTAFTSQPVKLNSSSLIFYLDKCSYSLIKALNENFTEREQFDIIRLLVLHKFTRWMLFEMLPQHERSLMCSNDIFSMFPLGTSHIYFARRIEITIYETTKNIGDILLNSLIRLVRKSTKMISKKMQDRLIQQFRQTRFTITPIDHILLLHNVSIKNFLYIEEKVGFFRAYFAIYPLLYVQGIRMTSNSLDSHVPRVVYDIDKNTIDMSLSMFVKPWYFTDGVEGMNAGRFVTEMTRAALELASSALNMTGYFYNIFDNNASLRNEWVRDVYNRYDFMAVSDQTNQDIINLIEKEKRDGILSTFALWSINKDDRGLTTFRRDERIGKYSSDALFYIARCFKYCAGSNESNLFQMTSKLKCNAPLIDDLSFVSTFNCPVGSSMRPNKYQQLNL